MINFVIFLEIKKKILKSERRSTNYFGYILFDQALARIKKKELVDREDTLEIDC